MSEISETQWQKDFGHPKPFKDRERGDLGYGWRVADNISSLSETIGYYRRIIADSGTPSEDRKIFENGLYVVSKQLSYWEKEKEYCEKAKNKEIAYSLKG